MTQKSNLFFLHIPRIVMCVTLLSLVLQPGCGKEEEPPPAAPVVEQPTPPPPTPAVDPNRPMALSVLQYAPEQTVFALALPEVDALITKAEMLADRFVDDSELVNLKSDEIIGSFVGKLGIEGVTTLEDFSAESGLNSAAPLAVFGTLGNSLDEFQKIVESISLPDNANAEEQLAALEQAAAESLSLPDNAKAEEQLAALEQAAPGFLLICGFSDKEKAGEYFENLLSKSEYTNERGLEELTVGSTKLKTSGALGNGYFFDNTNVFFGTVNMLKGAAERLSNPLAIKYGTPEYPAKAKNEIVGMVYPRRYMEISTNMMLFSAVLDPKTLPFYESQIANMQKMFELEGEEEPSLGTLTWTDEAIDFEALFDTRPYPNFMPMTGEAKPLRLAQLVPKETPALIAFRITEEQKKMSMDTYLPLATAQGDEDAAGQMAMATAMAPQAMEMFGEEIALAVRPGAALFPDAHLMLTLKKPAEIKGMLQMFGMVTPKETYKEVEISTIPLPIPLPIELTLSFAGDVGLISTNLAQAKTIIDLIKEDKGSGYLATLDPPLDPNTPRYAAITVDTAKLKTILEPLAALQGEEGQENLELLQLVSSVIKDLRIVTEMEGTEIRSQAIVNLHEVQ